MEILHCGPHVGASCVKHHRAPQIVSAANVSDANAMAAIVTISAPFHAGDTKHGKAASEKDERSRSPWCRCDSDHEAHNSREGDEHVQHVHRRPPGWVRSGAGSVVVGGNACLLAAAPSMAI
jgi:hypothetical protein